jgi:V/A-type H+-transporting ATPase subunit E
MRGKVDTPITEPMDENLRKLARVVLHEANAEADRILAEAKTKTEIVLQRAQEQAEAEHEAILQKARQEAENIRSEAIAAAELQAQTARLENREKLLNRVFEAARERLPTITQWTDYDQIARQLAREAVTHLGDQEVRIRTDTQTGKLLSDDALAELSEELGIQLQSGATLPHGTGVVAETVDGHRQYDNTLQARLNRQQDLLRAPVYRILMGKSQ